MLSPLSRCDFFLARSLYDSDTPPPGKRPKGEEYRMLETLLHINLPTLAQQHINSIR